MEVNILPEITSSLVSVQNILSITVLDLGLARVYDIMCGNSEVAYIWSRKSAVSVLFSYLSKLALKSLIRMMCLFFLFISFFVNIGHEMIIKFFKFYARMTVNAATNHLFMFLGSLISTKIDSISLLSKFLRLFLNFQTFSSSFIYKSAPPFALLVGQCSML